MSSLSALLQAEAEETLPAKTVNFQSMAVVKSRQKIDPASRLNADQRAMMLERLEFCRRTWSNVINGATQSDAVAAVTTRASEFPRLVRGGKGKSSALTIWNYQSWMKRLGKKHGKPDWKNSVALADQYCKNIRGASGAPEFWTTFNALYLTEQKLSICEAFRLAKCMCNKNGIAPIPSERQVRYWIKTYADQAAVLAARHGETWFENHGMSYIRRDWSSVQPNDIWIGDHHVFDATVRVWDEAKNDWRATRPWLTAWLDAKSLSLPGVCIRADDPDHVAVLTALQNGIRCAGNTPPGCLYTDNGKDFLKHGVGEPFCPPGTEYEHSVCAELGAKTIRSIPYRARAKTVERIFKEVCERFSRRWAQYLGNKPDARPEVSGFFYKHPEHLPNLHEFTEQFMKFLDEEYHTKNQDGKILEGKCPKDVWNSRPEGRVMTDRELWFAMLTPYSRNCPKVARGAAVSIDGKEYRSEELWAYFGKKIMVKLDPVNGGNPQAFTLDGKHICELEPIHTVPAYALTKEDRKLIAEGMKQQRREVKRVYGVADEMSGGLRRVAAQGLLSLKPGEPVEVVKAQSRKSVKGGSHNFTLHLAKTPGGKAALEPRFAGEALRELTRGEEKKEELEAFNEAIVAPEESKEEASSSETIADFHKMIIENQKQKPQEW